MWFFGLVFWLMLPLFFIAIALRRWRWRRWAMVEGGPYAPYLWGNPSWYGHRAPERWRPDHSAPEEIERQRAHIDALENKLAELEERLDFTERLLEGRTERGEGRGTTVAAGIGTATGAA